MPLAIFFLFLSGFAAWIISTIAGGGGALLLVPLVGFIAGAEAVAPVVTLATLIGGGGRLFVFGRDIAWRVVIWALPGGILGAALGAIVFTSASTAWLTVIIGLFLLSAPLQHHFGKKARIFNGKPWHFLPAQLVVGAVSGLIGAVGPVMNSLYLNAGITKSEMVGTKTAISMPMHFVKIGTYASLGAMSGQLWLFGLAAGVGALVSNTLAKRILTNMSDVNFRFIVTGFMAISGALMLWQARDVVLGSL